MKNLLKLITPTRLHNIESNRDPATYSLMFYSNKKAPSQTQSLLSVAENEHVFFLENRTLLAKVAFGLHILDKQFIPDVFQHYSWTDDYRGEIYSEIVFISTERQINRSWATPASTSQFSATGTYSFRVNNCEKLIHQLLESEIRLSDETINKIVQREIVRGISNFLGRGVLNVNQAATVPMDVRKLSTPEIRHLLEPYGINDIRFSIKSFKAIASSEDLTISPIMSDTPMSSSPLSKDFPLTPAPDTKVSKVAIIPEKLKKANFYIDVNGTQEGPFSLSELMRSIQDGTVSSDTRIWYAELEQWQPITEIGALNELVADIAMRD